MERLYFSISEVSEMVDEEQHILRYWEKEFAQIKPKKNRGGNRAYSKKDIDLIKIVKRLLRDEKISLKATKDYIAKLDFNKLEAKQIVFSADNLNKSPKNSNNSIKNSNTSISENETITSDSKYNKLDTTTKLVSNDSDGISNSSVLLSKTELREILDIMKKTLELLKN